RTRSTNRRDRLRQPPLECKTCKLVLPCCGALRTMGTQAGSLVVESWAHKDHPRTQTPFGLTRTLRHQPDRPTLLPSELVQPEPTAPMEWFRQGRLAQVPKPLAPS